MINRINIIFYFLDNICNKIQAESTLSGYDVDLVPVDKSLKTTLSEFKKKGYQIFILSGKSPTNKKLEFINRTYGDIFGNEVLDEFNTFKNIYFQDYKNGYYYEKGKVKFITKLSETYKDQDLTIGVIEDNLTTINSMKKELFKQFSLCQTKKPLTILLWPYPSLVKAASPEALLKEIELLIDNIDTTVVEKFLEESLKMLALLAK